MFGLLDYLKMGAGIAAGLMLYHLYAVSIGYPSARREARADAGGCGSADASG
jgi:hypothetical protein